MGFLRWQVGALFRAASHSTARSAILLA